MEKNVDKKRFHLIHRMVSMLSQIKGLDARYDSRDVHKGMFIINFEGTDYDVLVSKHHEKNEYRRRIDINTAYSDNSSNITAWNNNNKVPGPTEVRNNNLGDIFDSLEDIIMDMFGDI